MSTTSAPTRLTDDEIYDIAVHLVNAMLDSASTDVIKPTAWWDRARTALETGAAASTTWPRCVSRMARKLQIETLTKAAGETLTGLGSQLDTPEAFAAWRRAVVRDAVYIVAMARVARDARKAATRTNRLTPADIQAPLIGDSL